AVGVREAHAAVGELVHVGRLRLWMSAEPAAPVVEVIHNDEEDIGTFGRRDFLIWHRLGFRRLHRRHGCCGFRRGRSRFALLGGALQRRHENHQTTREPKKRSQARKKRSAGHGKLSVAAASRGARKKGGHWVTLCRPSSF